MAMQQQWIWPLGLLTVLALLVASEGAVQRGKLRRSQPLDGSSAGWEDMTCFMDLARFGLTVSKNDVLFRSGHATSSGDPEVLVVQDKSKVSNAPRRTLVFRSADGKCNEQAGTVCSVAKSESFASVSDVSGFGTSSLGADEALMSSGGATSMDKCAMNTCTADVGATLQEPGAGYVRSMVGAASLLPGTPNADRRFLSIGLGAGTMALVLQQAFPGSQQTVVELSPDVAAAAQCFGAGSGSGLEIATGDGRAYLESATDASFDAVFVDAFDATDKVPSCFTTSEFFAMTKRKLKGGGILVMNAHSGKTLHNDVKDILPAASASFGGAGKLQVGTAPGLANAIVLAQVEGGKSSPSALLQDAGMDLSSWFQDALFNPAENNPSAKGHTFTDAEVRCSVR